MILHSQDRMIWVFLSQSVVNIYGLPYMLKGFFVLTRFTQVIRIV